MYILREGGSGVPVKGEWVVPSNSELFTAGRNPMSIVADEEKVVVRLQYNAKLTWQYGCADGSIVVVGFH